MTVAFIAMGSWATFANLAHPMPRPLIAGVVQGTLSALITLFLKRMIEVRLLGAANGCCDRFAESAQQHPLAGWYAGDTAHDRGAVIDDCDLCDDLQPRVAARVGAENVGAA